MRFLFHYRNFFTVSLPLDFLGNNKIVINKLDKNEIWHESCRSILEQIFADEDFVSRFGQSGRGGPFERQPGVAGLKCRLYQLGGPSFLRRFLFGSKMQFDLVGKFSRNVDKRETGITNN